MDVPKRKPRETVPEAVKMLEALFPLLKESLDLFRRRTLTHAAINITSEHIKDFVALAISHALDQRDRAFSSHAYQHKVAKEAAQIFARQAQEPSAQFQIRLEKDHKTKKPRFVIEGLEEVKIQNLEPYDIFGQRIEELIEKLDEPARKKWLKTTFKEIAQQAGVSFAVLTVIRAGLDPAELLDICKHSDMQVLKREGRLALPSQSRNGDEEALEKILLNIKGLNGKNGSDKKSYGAQMDHARFLAETQWGQIQENLKGLRAYQIYIKPRAVFESLAGEATRVAYNKPFYYVKDRDDWIESKTDLITSQVVTVYLVHRHEQNSNGRAKEAINTMLTTVSSLPTPRTAAAQTDP